MKLEYFIAKRLITSKEYKSSVSSPIIKIAITAIAISIVMMLISIATGIGLQEKIREKVSAFNGHVIISSYTGNQSDVSTEPISINQKFYPKFKAVSGIKNIQAVASKAGIIRTEKSFEGILFKGVGKDYDWNNIDEYIVQGRHPNLLNDLNDEIIISQYLANRLDLKIGSKCSTYFMKQTGNKMPNLRVYTIVGIFNSGFQEFDATYILGDIRHVQRINKWSSNQIGSFEVFINDFDLIDTKAQAIYDETTSTLKTESIKEKYYFIFEWLHLFDFNIIIILTIMIIVSTINMVVALLVLILERSQMIGILKSQGANNWTIRKMFLYVATYLIGIGLFIGNVIGIGLIFIQDYFGIIKLNPQSYYVDRAPVYFSIWHVLLLNIGTILICLLVLLIPSYIITKISPAKSIRFD